MEALKSTALVPGEPEYKSEYNLLNILLFKVPKNIDLRQILKAKPLQPRHCLALQELHSELFPIRYDPRFFEVACSTECGFFDSKSFWDFFDFKVNTPTDKEWYNNQIMSIGLFLPRSYVSFFRKTGEYEVEKYLKFLIEDDQYTEFDDPLTEMLVYDIEYDEFMVGFVTLLINMDVTNNLISDDDYTILTSFFKNQLLPCIYSGYVNVDNDYSNNKSNKDNNTKDIRVYNKKNEDNKYDNKENKELKEDNNHSNKDNEIEKKEILYETYDKEDENTVKKIRNCVKLNESLFDDSIYSFFYNQLYTNELLLEYTSKFSTKNAKSLYILSTGITLGLRSRSLGTNLILFVQVLIYFVNHGFYIFKDKYYRLFDNHQNLNKNRDYYSSYSDYNNDFNDSNKDNNNNLWELRDNFENVRNILNAIKNHYNNKVFNIENVYTYYNYILDSNYVPYNCDSIINNYFENKKYEFTLGDIRKKSKNKKGKDDIICPTGSDTNDSSNINELLELLDEDMPLVIYLHTIYYNEFATKVYEKLNFYHIATIPDYYLINDKKYDARFLAYYMYL